MSTKKISACIFSNFIVGAALLIACTISSGTEPRDTRDQNPQLDESSSKSKFTPDLKILLADAGAGASCAAAPNACGGGCSITCKVGQAAHCEPAPTFRRPNTFNPNV